MLDPVLPHNLEEYNRLGRRKNKAFLLALLCIPLVVLLLVALVRRDAPEVLGEIVIIGYLAAVFIVIGVFELKRVLAFRRDLHEQRRIDDTQNV